ncbi:hypothetical protein J6590_045729 [Homalodisca vitripennis]|nr:hypothetical protein J6590_045729 [Homalodisca vitripennis]
MRAVCQTNYRMPFVLETYVNCIAVDVGPVGSADPEVGAPISEAVRARKSSKWAAKGERADVKQFATRSSKIKPLM